MSTDWTDLGGALMSPPAVCSWSSKRLDVFAIDAEGHLIHKWWNLSLKGSNWNDGWEDLGGSLRESWAPSAVSWGPNRIDVFARGTNDHLMHRWWDGTAWSGWQDLGGKLTSSPAAVSAGPNDLAVFATQSSTFADCLTETSYTPNNQWGPVDPATGWNPWTCGVGATLKPNTSPGAVSGLWTKNTDPIWSVAHVYWCDNHTAGLRSMLRTSWTSGAPAWQTPGHDHGGVLTSGPAVAAYPPAPNPVAFARGLDGKLWEFRSAWHALGGDKIVGHPAAVFRTKSSTDVFALSESGTLLWRQC
jgi:hypothetical protein